MADRPAETKRVKISKAQRLTLLEVLGASLVLGTCLVVVNFLVKYIGFNTKIISAKNDAISDYDQTIRNIGICVDVDKNGRLDRAEIEQCEPSQVRLDNVRNSLRYNVYNTVAWNEDLESVARKREQYSVCFNDDGSIHDFTDDYDLAITEKDKIVALQGMRLCSALRVIPDALPAQKNTEALMASLNQIFIESGVEPEAIAPSDDRIASDIKGVSVIPVTFRVNGTGAEIIHVLDSLENSIREFDITSAMVEWTTAGLSLRANANAYYYSEDMALEADKVVTPKTGGKK